MRYYIFVFLCIISLSTLAQENPEKINSFLDNTEFKIGYTGNIFWNNGLNLGAENLWKENIKERKTKQKTISYEYLFNGNLAFTNNFSSKTDAGIYTNYGLTWRRTNPKGRQISFEFNPLGYYRSFLPETYEVIGDDVEKVFLPGRGYYAPSFSVGIGKLREGKKLTGRYFNVNVMWRTPYNAGVLPSISLQYGFRLNAKKKN